MKIVHFPEATNSAAGIHFYADPKGFTVIAIELDAKDVKALKKNGKLYVIAGPGFLVPPPMQITLDNPFTPMLRSERSGSIATPFLNVTKNEKKDETSTGDDKQSNDGNN
jgi:hypothetical protein